MGGVVDYSVEVAFQLISLLGSSASGCGYLEASTLKYPGPCCKLRYNQIHALSRSVIMTLQCTVV